MFVSPSQMLLFSQDVPLAISKVNTLFALAKQSRSLGAFKLARYAYERLQQLKVVFLNFYSLACLRSFFSVLYLVVVVRLVVCLLFLFSFF